ncbi:hypothetical protein ACIBQ1_34300 [Nonomuraea sp. NPDC050153]|uniref:WXG100-like domain-containing protein n=1 Tax=Nonomuraea sp. NPDC050153 TaxID=3364359 RepID=UPI0037A4D422
MMAGRSNVNDARKPAASAHVFDGGIATKDVEPVWQTEALPGWVVHHLIPLLTAGQSWPKGSESKLWELRVEYVRLMNLLIGTLDPTAATVQTLNGSLQSPAKPAIFKRLATLSDDKAGVVAKAQEAFSYAKMVDNFARETQYSKLSVNVAFWVAVIAAFIALIAAGFVPLASLLLRSVGTAGASRIALIMQRLVLAASKVGPVAKSGQITRLAAAGTGSKFLNKALIYELFEEITEEVFIDVYAQYQQIKMGTRDAWDWKKIQAAAIGAGAGAVIGTRLGGPVSRFTNDLPGISRLNRIAGDNRGVGNAFLRFPGRALNTGLNNMAASPAGSVAANYFVYDQFSLPGAEGMYGGFLGGAGRTNTISPFSWSVVRAGAKPMAFLSNLLNEAMAGVAAHHGGPGTAGGTATGPAIGGAPLPADGNATFPAPLQQQSVDIAGPARRDRAATTTEPTVPQTTSIRVSAAPAPDIITPDAGQSKPVQNNNAKPQPDLPAPRNQAEPDTQHQARHDDQDQRRDQGSAPQPDAQNAPPAHQQSTATTEHVPAEAASASATTPPSASSSQPTSASDQANTPQAGTPEHTGEPTAADALEPISGSRDAGAPDTSTASEIANALDGVTAEQHDRPIGTTPDGPGHGAVTHAAPDPASHFIPDGRTSPNDLTEAEARRRSRAELIPEDFGDAVTAITWLSDTQLIVQHQTLGELHFTVQVGPVKGGYLGQTEADQSTRNGRPSYTMTLAPRVHEDQVARLVLHEISDVIQHRLEKAHTHTPGQATRDECVTARRNELRFLQRKLRAARAAGDADIAERLAREIAAVELDLEKRTRPSPSIDNVINFGQPGEAETTGTEGDGPAHLSALDHATRTPQLNMNPATWPGEQYANVYDPREVPWAHQWEDLRASATPIPVKITRLPTSGAVSVEVRRLLVPWRGSTRPVTEFTLRVLYRADPDVGPDDLAIAHANLLNGIDLYYNYQHQLPDGSQLHIRMELIHAPDSSPAEGVIKLRAGAGHIAAEFADRKSWYGDGEPIRTPLEQLHAFRRREPIHYMNWHARQEPVVFAHEVLHLLDLTDEYVRGSVYDRSWLGAPGVRADANLAGDAFLRWTRQMGVLDRDGHLVPEITGLRDRYLEHFYALIPESDARANVPLHRPLTPSDAEEWTRSAYVPSAHLPRDIRSLLDAFPAEDRPLLDHLMLLDRMAGLFHHLPRSALNRQHLEYTETLIKAAQEIFETGPEHSFVFPELGWLNYLSGLLAPNRMPHYEVLRQEINRLLGRDLSAPVENRLIRYLVKTTTAVSPLTGETGPATVHRAVANDVYRLMLALRQAPRLHPAQVAELTQVIAMAEGLEREITASASPPVDAHPAADWVRPARVPGGRQPVDMPGLLAAFPREARSLREHLGLLESMEQLFRHEPRLTRRHLEYAEALIETAREIYEVTPGHIVDIRLLDSLAPLARLLLGQMPPRPRPLYAEINRMLTRDTSAPVESRLVQYLVGVATVTPLPGETGPAAIHRAVIDEINRWESDLSGTALLNRGRAEKLAHRLAIAKQLEREMARRESTDPASWQPGRQPTETEGTDGPGHGEVTHGSPDRASRFIPDGRTSGKDLTEAEVRELSEPDLIPEDFGDAVTAITWLSNTELIVQHTTLGELHFTVEVGPVEGGYLGQTSAAEDNPGNGPRTYTMTLAPRVHEDQVARLVLHEISDVIQHQLEQAHTHTPGQATRDECVTARRNELRYLQRKHQAAQAAGNTELAELLAQDIAAVQIDLDKRTRPSPSIDNMINFGQPGEFVTMGIEGGPEPVNANVFKVTLSDGSAALLLELSTSMERDLQLLVTQFANRLGLAGLPRAAGDRHILIDWPPRDASSGFLGTREAVLAGYLIALADMTPLVTRPALHVPASGTPLLQLFLREDSSGERGWGSNPLSWEDVQVLATMLEDARADFVSMGLQHQFDEIMKRHWSLAGGPLAVNAVGLESVVAASPGHRLPLYDLERLKALDEGSHSPRAGTNPASEDRAINPARRLHLNIRQGIVSERESALGHVVTFADGSQALRIPFVDAREVLVRALARRALGLAGPAVDLDADGYVWVTFGNNELRASVATGISRVTEVPGPHGRTTEVVFGDGRRALRHEFPTRAAADEYEARLEEAHEVSDGLPGSHRATPFIIYEELTHPLELSAETRARLATRALYTLLSHGRPIDHTTLRRLLDANSLLVQFGEATDWDFRAGAPVLSAHDVASLTARFEALRDTFRRIGLAARYERLLETLSRFAGSDDARLIPLAVSEELTTAEYRVPAWRPPPGSGPILSDLLQNDHLSQVNARNQADVISRADAELAERPSAEGHVFARLPEGLIPPDIRPGEEFAVDTLLDGVDNADVLPESPHGVRVTILATDYVPVGDLSGKPHHALFRAGDRFAVTATLVSDDGEVHYFLTQQPASPVARPVITPTIGLTRDLAHDLTHHLTNAVSRTQAGILVQSGLSGDGRRPTIRPVDGAFVVECRYSEQGMMIGGRRLPAEVAAAMLLRSPDLPPGAAILLAGPHDGTTTFAQSLAWFTGRVVLAADGPVETTPQGNLRIGNTGRTSGQFKIFLPADTSVMVAEQLLSWLGPEPASATGEPRTTRGRRPRPPRQVQPPSLPDSMRGDRSGEAAGLLAPPPLMDRHHELISRYRHEVTAGIWYRDEDSAVMPTADPRLLRRSTGIIEVAIAGDGTSFLIGSDRISTADLATMLAHDPRVLAQPNAWLRILGCEMARNQAVLQELADLTGRSILGANEVVYIGADRHPHTAAVQEYDSTGRPIFPRDDDGHWLDAHPSAPVAAPHSAVPVTSPPPAPRRGLPHHLGEAALAADLGDWQLFPEQGKDGRVAHLDVEGTKVVRKKTRIAQVRAEVLAAIIGQLIGANVPAVVEHPTDPTVVFMEYVHGRHPADNVRTNSVRGAILIELLDVLIVNNDRHRGNLKITEDGLTGLDHGRAFQVDDSRPSLLGKSLRGNFVAEDADGRAVWVDNPLSRQDVEFLTDVMMSLLPHYQHHGFHAAYDVALDRLYHIGMHAKGETSLIAPAAPAPTRVQHHFGWDFDDHNAVVQDAARRLADGEDVASIVPYMTRDAINLDLAFGLELEFTRVGGDMRAWHEDIALMARELHRAGLAASPKVFPHHRAPASMSGRSHMEWESIGDRLGGEFITGILRDTGQTWAELPLVTEIIRSHGGEITPDAGGHIHVGAPRLGTDVNALHRLLTLYYGYEDVLFRLGQDPREPYGMHRPYHACQPNEFTSTAETSTAALRSANSRPAALNLSTVVGTDNDHVEFRHNDGHLDPSIIQARVKLAVAMVNYALHGGEYLPPRDQLGLHLEYDWSPHQDAASFIDMVNTLFTRQADKEQLTALFAITQWQAASEDGRWAPR